MTNDGAGASDPNPLDDLMRLPLDRHCVVVAGPGTGKTWALARRVEHIVERGDCGADEIAALTLTQSIARHLQREVRCARVGTLHSFSLHHLNSIGTTHRRRIVDSWEQDNLVVPDLQLLTGPDQPHRDAVQEFLRRLGAGFRENQTEEPDLTTIERQLREAWLFLREFMQFRVFDELAYDLLRHLESGGTLRNCPKVILVDEYQDLTPCELALLRAIAERHATAVFACGDDRQSIFGFRDADPLALNNFCRVYEIEKPLYFSVTRRCPARICALAEEVASQVPAVLGLSDRPPLRPHPDLPPGDVAVFTFPSTVAEARWVHSQVKSLLAQGSESGEVMVIVPYGLNVYLRFLNEAASSDGSGVSYYDTRTPDPVREQLEFRALYAFCRLTNSRDDQLAWRTLLHLARGWGVGFMQRVFRTEASTLAVALRQMAELDGRTARFVRSAEEVCEMLRRSTEVGEACGAVGGWLQEFAGVGNANWGAVLTVAEVAELLSACATAGGSAFSCGELASALMAASSAQRADRPAGKSEVGVHTIHQAKGLQASHVFLMGAFTQAFVDRGNPADGVRRLYVAVTRARSQLTITVGRFVRGRRNPLCQLLGVNSVELSPHVSEAARRAGVVIANIQP